MVLFWREKFGRSFEAEFFNLRKLDENNCSKFTTFCLFDLYSHTTVLDKILPINIHPHTNLRTDQDSFKSPFQQIKKVWLIGLVLNEEIPNPIFRFFVRRPFNWWCLAALDTVSQLILLRISNFPHFCQWRPNGRRGEVWIRRISAISHSAQYGTVECSGQTDHISQH